MVCWHNGVVIQPDAVPDATGKPAPDVNAEWWTTSDVAAYLGLRVGTVSSYRRRGQMPAPDNTIGRTHIWKPARIIAWHKSRPRPGVGGRPVPPAESAPGQAKKRS